MLFAMHMANELLNLPVAGATLALAAAAVALAARRSGRTLDAERLPLMGVMGAFVFAAQMINFTLPGLPGTSGHLGGGVLLAILLGPAAGIVAMAAILIVQCLLFQDGGLLALGCNILNMGVVPCLAGWGLYRLVLGSPERAGAMRQYLAAWLACLVGVSAGAALVPVQAAAAGVLRVDLGTFWVLMVGVHLVIGLIEGLITFSVLAYLRQVRPAAVGLAVAERPGRLGRPALAGSLLLTAGLLAGVVSWFASGQPDGLEWTLDQPAADGGHVLAEPAPPVSAVSDWQARWSPLADYTRRDAPWGAAPLEQDTAAAEAAAGPDGWGSLAGLVGTALVLAALFALSRLLRRRPLPDAAKAGRQGPDGSR